MMTRWRTSVLLWHKRGLSLRMCLAASLTGIAYAHLALIVCERIIVTQSARALGILSALFLAFWHRHTASSAHHWRTLCTHLRGASRRGTASRISAPRSISDGTRRRTHALLRQHSCAHRAAWRGKWQRGVNVAASM